MSNKNYYTCAQEELFAEKLTIKKAISVCILGEINRINNGKKIIELENIRMLCN
jgi:hypothetical protein